VYLELTGCPAAAHQIAPIFGLIAVIVVGMVFWATRPTPAAA
jgi:hypothetical protein